MGEFNVNKSDGSLEQTAGMPETYPATQVILSDGVTSVEDALDEISENVIKQTAGTSITLNGQYILYHDNVQYNGFAMFPFMTKNTDYTVSINAASQDNVGDVLSNMTVGYKDQTGFRFTITGTYGNTKCGLGLNYTITFA